MSAAVRLFSAISAAALLAALAVGTAGTGASGVAKRSCQLSPHEQRHLGASYVTSLSVEHTSCAKGKKVTKAFNNCRHNHGGPAGHCHQAVRGFICSEDRYDVLPGVQYSSKVSCKNGIRRVHFNYTQNT